MLGRVAKSDILLFLWVLQLNSLFRLLALKNLN
jgi:hypothetical protein